MPQQDTSKLKERIIETVRRKGPSLPVHIASEIQTSILFTSAFLSELMSEKRIKITNMRVGSSPVYFLSGQEPQIERYSQHLKSREKDAFILLKEKGILKDDEQEPAIRVALRSIRDFAIPLEKNGNLYWKYFTAEDTVKETPKEIPSEKPQETIKENPSEQKENKEQLNIFEEKKENPQENQKTEEIPKEEPKKPLKKTTTRKTTTKKKTSPKANEKFFNKVKEYLSQHNIEISDIEGFTKTELFLKINENGREKLLIAYNKKRIAEDEIIKAYKKASEMNLDYIILSLGEPSKKISTFMEAAKKIEKMDKLE